MPDAAIPRLSGVVIGGDAALAGAVRDALGADGVQILGGLPGARQLDILVFIAAAGVAEGVTGVSVAAFSDGLGGELGSAFLSLQLAVAAMRAKGAGGSVVFVAPTSAGRRAFGPLQQGLRLMTKAAALELGPEGIRVNIVLPGDGDAPLGRSCTPDDVAASVAFVASDRARFMTGADLVVDGGRAAR